MTDNHEASVPRRIISVQATRIAMEAALAEADALGVRSCVAIHDSGDNLVGFLRMPGAFHISSQVAQLKSRQAAGLGLAPADMEAALAGEQPRVQRGLEAVDGFTPVHGGLPIHDNGYLVGGIGVSGGSEAQDVQCAQAGIDAIKRQFGQ
jgi:uncharacterized protein GlcG (DUF336 family)